MLLRRAHLQDQEAIRRICLAAFSTEDGTTVSQLAVALLKEDTTPGCIHLIAEAEGEHVGCATFSPVWLNDARPAGFILAPLGVIPARQKMGIGTALIAEGLALCRAAGAVNAFVYGDPAYYARFGFSAELAHAYPAPHPLSYPFGWQAARLLEANANLPHGKLHCVAPLDSSHLW